MKKLFQKLLQKLVKKVVKKAVSNNQVAVPETDPITLDSESDVAPDNAQASAVKTKDPWWVLFLKVLSYIISIILGGVVTSCGPQVF